MTNTEPCPHCPDGHTPPVDGTPGPENHAEHAGTSACDGVPGIRGLLEHVGIDTTGHDITVAGKIVDTVLAVRDRELQQLRHERDRLEEMYYAAMCNLGRLADAKDAAAGSYAHRAEQAEKRLRVYVAGPYSADPERNVQTATDAADQLLAAGHAPLVPHLKHPWIQAADHPYETWFALDTAWLAVADAVLRLDGESPGADREVALAHQLGIPVHHDIDGLTAHQNQPAEPTNTPEEQPQPTEAEQIADTIHALQTIVNRVRNAVTTDEPTWTPPPPGDTREQLPGHLLALIDPPDYLSTACSAGQLLAAAIPDHPAHAAELDTWLHRMHSRCRLNMKFTGAHCQCFCHVSKETRS